MGTIRRVCAALLTLIYRDVLLITATLNCLSVLVKTRSSLSSRILNAVLSFNPLSLALKNPSTRTKLLAKCIEKTVRIFLLNLIRYMNHY